MIDHELVHTALRERLLSLVVCTTTATPLGADVNGFTRSSGSFVDDGFAVGMEVIGTGFAESENLRPRVITRVADLSLEVAGATIEEAEADGRTLTVALPRMRAWENSELVPVTGRPFIEERYSPAPPALYGSYRGGLQKDAGLYVVNWYGQANTGLLGLTRCVDALLAHFPPGLDIVNTSSTIVQVRPDLPPYRSSLSNTAPGRAAITVTIPYRAYTAQHLN